mgnify:CR=1 FL=1
MRHGRSNVQAVTRKAMVHLRSTDEDAWARHRNVAKQDGAGASVKSGNSDPGSPTLNPRLYPKCPIFTRD